MAVKIIKNKKIEKEVKKILSEKYPNLFNYFSDLEAQKQLSFSDYSFVLPYKTFKNKNDEDF